MRRPGDGHLRTGRGDESHRESAPAARHHRENQPTVDGVSKSWATRPRSCPQRWGHVRIMRCLEQNVVRRRRRIPINDQKFNCALILKNRAVRIDVGTRHPDTVEFR